MTFFKNHSFNGVRAANSCAILFFRLLKESKSYLLSYLFSFLRRYSLSADSRTK
jgi:hypothetical protein